MSKFNKIITPSSMLIEKTAGDLAATFYEGCRSAGIPKGKYKDARHFARAKLELFIPKAVELLIDIMHRPTTPASQKEIIYDAIMERTNDEQLAEMGKVAGLPEFERTVLYKPDVQPKPKPIIVNTEKFEG